MPLTPQEATMLFKSDSERREFLDKTSIIQHVDKRLRAGVRTINFNPPLSLRDRNLIAAIYPIYGWDVTFTERQLNRTWPGLGFFNVDVKFAEHTGPDEEGKISKIIKFDKKDLTPYLAEEIVKVYEELGFTVSFEN